MKKIYLLSIALYTMTIASHAQTTIGDYLDINNIKAFVSASGTLFETGFEVPKGSGKSTISTAALWIGGYDAGKSLKIAAQTYRQNGTDFWPGPLDVAATIDSSTMYAYNKVWKINQSDIDAYINWFSGGSLGPIPVNAAAMDAINTWPAFDPIGSSLAPFMDANSNYIYDPQNGDYPLIKGDQAIFFVYNDKGGIHTESGGTTLGLEIQGMAYAYSCSGDSALYNTIFTNYKIINKSSIRIDSAYIGNWTDIDIGGGGGDYMGCDVMRGAYYGYNTVNPSVQAVVFLTGPLVDANGIDDAPITNPTGINYGDGVIDNERLGMSNFLSYNNDFTLTGNPTLATHYYNYMQNIWNDGTPTTYGGNGHLSSGPVCKYMFPGTSDSLGYGTGSIQSPWDGISSGNAPKDKRGIGSFGPFPMQPGAVNEVDFAYVYNRAGSGGNIASIAIMQDRIDSIRMKFNSFSLKGCNSGTNGIKDLSNNNSFSIYPNPATNTIIINYKPLSKNYSIKIYDATGRIIKNIEHINSTTSTINIEDLNAGIYLVNVYDGTNSVTHRLIKQ